MPYWPDEDPMKRYLLPDLPTSPQVGGFPAGGTSPVGPAASGGMKGIQKKSFQDLINSDPIFAQFRDALGAQGIVDAGSRRAAIQRALINFGLIPDFSRAGVSEEALGFLGSDVDAGTRSRANDMTSQGLSFLARLNKANSGAVSDLKNELAGKGILESGATGYGLREQAQAYKTSMFDAEQSLFDTLMGYIGNYTESERQRQQELLDAMSDAADRTADDEFPGLEGTPGGDAKPPKPSKPQPLPTAGPNRSGAARDLVPSEGGALGGATKNPRKKRRPNASVNKGKRIAGGV